MKTPPLELMFSWYLAFQNNIAEQLRTHRTGTVCSAQWKKIEAQF